MKNKIKFLKNKRLFPVLKGTILLLVMILLNFQKIHSQIPISMVATERNVSCDNPCKNNGNISVAIAGGTPFSQLPHYSLWLEIIENECICPCPSISYYSDGWSNLCPGTYLVSATDSIGNTITDTVFIVDCDSCFLPEVFAGENIDVCDAHTLSDAYAVDYDHLLWTTSGDGNINNPEILNPIYYPGPNDLISGSVTLCLNAIGYEPCANTADCIILSVYGAPLVDAGMDTEICDLDCDLNALYYVVNPSLNLQTNWSMVSGPGTAVFLDDSDPNTSVTVSQYGEYVFAFTVGNGPCQVSDEVTVEFYLVEPLSVPPDGSGTMASPYLIQSLENLYWIAEQPNSGNNFSGKYFLQTNDIDLSETETWFCGRGWIPIGNYLTPFKGSYDGGSHSIVSLYINRPDENYIGLFGVVDNAVFRNLQLLDFDITGNKFVGSLSGSAKNTTNISYVDVNNAQIYLSENYGGGLVGQALYSTSIYRCSSSGEISKDGLYTANWIGGLAGSLAESAIVEESYSTTNVTSLKHNIYAGLVGVIWTGGIIRNSYARGSVTGTWAIAGGFVGDNQTGIIQTSYSTGLVSAPSLYVGGFIGRNLSGSYLNNFWDKETSGQTTSTGATGKTTSEMKTQTTFTNAGWDFQNVWRMDGVTNNGYPFLLWQVVPLVNTVTDISIPAGGMQCFDALQSIHVSDFTVEPDGRADFIAGQNIFFHPGTHVMPGGEMWARIAMNNQYCSQYTTLAPSLSKGSVMAAPLKTISAENSFFKVFPNPTPGRFTLELKEVSETSPVSVEMFTMIGEPVMKLDLPVMKQYMIDLSANQPGLYIIRVQQENELGVEKIIKQ